MFPFKLSIMFFSLSQSTEEVRFFPTFLVRTKILLTSYPTVARNRCMKNKNRRLERILPTSNLPTTRHQNKDFESHMVPLYLPFMSLFRSPLFIILAFCYLCFVKLNHSCSCYSLRSWREAHKKKQTTQNLTMGKRNTDWLESSFAFQCRVLDACSVQDHNPWDFSKQIPDERKFCSPEVQGFWPTSRHLAWFKYPMRTRASEHEASSSCLKKASSTSSWSEMFIILAFCNLCLIYCFVKTNHSWAWRS